MNQTALDVHRSSPLSLGHECVCVWGCQRGGGMALIISAHSVILFSHSLIAVYNSYISLTAFALEGLPFSLKRNCFPLLAKGSSFH